MKEGEVNYTRRPDEEFQDLRGSPCGPAFWISSAIDSCSMQHIEQHFSGSDTVRDVVIGMADGLTGG